MTYTTTNINLALPIGIFDESLQANFLITLDWQSGTYTGKVPLYVFIYDGRILFYRKYDATGDNGPQWRLVWSLLITDPDLGTAGIDLAFRPAPVIGDDIMETIAKVLVNFITTYQPASIAYTVSPLESTTLQPCCKGLVVTTKPIVGVGAVGAATYRIRWKFNEQVNNCAQAGIRNEYVIGTDELPGQLDNSLFVGYEYDHVFTGNPAGGLMYVQINYGCDNTEQKFYFTYPPHI